MMFKLQRDFLIVHMLKKTNKTRNLFITQRILKLQILIKLTIMFQGPSLKYDGMTLLYKVKKPSFSMV